MVTTKKRTKRTKRTLSKAVSATAPIRCVYHGKVIVPSEGTPSKTRYIFEPGQVLPVKLDDITTLLALSTPGGGCCGGSQSEPEYYFREV